MSQINESNRPLIDPKEILEGIVRWVRVESPSNEADAVNCMVDMVEGEMHSIGADICRIPGRDGFGDILKVRSPWGGDGPGILVLCHLDTVHPLGVLDGSLPVRQEDDRVYGPGIYDMKGGAHLAYYAYRHLVRQGLETPLPITFLYIPEEEVGSPTSREIIEAQAVKNKCVLVTEPAREGGKIVTARKGVALFFITATGRQAHAGSRHSDGRSAIKELAQQLIRLEALTDYDRGVTVNVGQIRGGTAINVVPGSCYMEVDMRVPDADTAASLVDRVLQLQPFDPDIALEIKGGLSRPPYIKDAGITTLFEHARGLAAEIGFELEDLTTGGCSDGNFTAALGVPTLDGLGVDGHGGHTLEEHLYYSCLVERTKLLLRLFETLE